MKMLEHRIPPPLLMATIAASMCGSSFWLAPASAPDRLTFWLAMSIFCASAVILALGLNAFRIAKTTIDPVHIHRASYLVSEGVYRYTRNPMYLGMTLMLLGLATYLANPWTLLGPLFFAIFIDRFQVSPEERAMEANFGNEYLLYKQRVRRWL